MKWFKISGLDVSSETKFMKKINVSGKKIIIVKSDGKLYATDTRCPHAGADLSQGWCSHGNVVCPYHRHEFNLETGRGKEGQGNYINTYPVEVREDGVYVGFSAPWWKFWV